MDDVATTDTITDPGEAKLDAFLVVPLGRDLYAVAANQTHENETGFVTLPDNWFAGPCPKDEARRIADRLNGMFREETDSGLSTEDRMRALIKKVEQHYAGLPQTHRQAGRSDMRPELVAALERLTNPKIAPQRKNDPVSRLGRLLSLLRLKL